jgi:hypothetical protein
MKLFDYARWSCEYWRLGEYSRNILAWSQYIAGKECQIVNAKSKGETLERWATAENKIQAACNHRKGGYQDFKTGRWPNQGTDSQYSVLKHMMPLGDIFIRCLRCGKWWKPPVKEKFKTEGAYVLAVLEYQAALDFPTHNTMSTSIQFRKNFSPTTRWQYFVALFDKRRWWPNPTKRT